MAKVKTIFVGANNSNTCFNELECYYQQGSNNIVIGIYDLNLCKDGTPAFIDLDRSTAIKLSKELRRQIALIQGEEINNG